ncbi:glycosyltransferase family 2 protein [Rhizobium ruizarguesonis]|jgi:GT2 family glycosyltransferase|uniref:glycosyltransferase family 2 protein n=1 Tax=Rhizobium ruizarguesonis TaxID=2081791 RepID=UPI00102F379E|nr:glycosyltransferase family 2 protein [Rhizobium ruizarguesonis]TAZ71699.1 glycosyltransferase family 2 protein [Rhizobium ruizarguesonis]TAZ98372.1 glycosyltransferase family 2 protein [Rhizobium ruizarguesonis]TBA14975.1 glycosyltransferase family 2 protein [Rhizobium ruizarguesonis]TBC42709.1 glycosyltransferase family 2 protein [Rhizobium ruizarguesonis]TBE64950.1 glycosyltransferase family 2 protein [Rhizobium ruizarguesonis]
MIVGADAILRVQSILYRTDVESLRLSYLALAHAARVLKIHGLVGDVHLAYGDCSPSPILSAATIEAWQREVGTDNSLLAEYHFFGANLGSARGHNTLMSKAQGPLARDGAGGFLAIMNPDVKLAGDTLLQLLKTLLRPGVGLVEARQLPMEHPKHYDEQTGETSWASTATAITTSKIYWEVDGFDADTFFLYCDDVDFSWRVRELGYKVVFQPGAVIFHDKRLTLEGGWAASEAEAYYSAEAALLLTHKWSRSDLTNKYLMYFKSGLNPVLAKAAAEFEKRRASNTLPIPRNNAQEFAQFVGLEYAKHRF